jgi:tetratricopeptide (TPR) repeat protein
MDQWIKFLSGNVPGGFFLYLLILFVTFLVLFFMHRVNDLFTRKYLISWSLVSFILVTIIYAVIWFRNPPAQILKRYSVDIINENGKPDWYTDYLNGLISSSLAPYVSEREYFFPPSWFYRITPSDSGSSRRLKQQAFTNLPVHKVLQGKIQRSGSDVQISFEMLSYPSAKVIKSSRTEFKPFDHSKFLKWLQLEFGRWLPFLEGQDQLLLSPPDSLLAEVKRFYQQRDYQLSLDLLNTADSRQKQELEYEILYRFLEIKLAGQQSKKEPVKNPYNTEIPRWKKDLQQSRDWLLKLLRQGYQHPQFDLLIAESYLWEENFASAEVFLEKLLVENPFDIEVLLNLTFLHLSRYQEFGFGGLMDIYQRILDLCPLDEAVLVQWVDKIIQGSPGYTAPPQYAQERIRNYLEINPYSSKGWLMLGQVYSHQFQKDAALQAYLQAESLAPQSGVVHYNLGALYYDWKNYDLSKVHLLKAIALDDYLDAYLYLGAILKEEGHYEEALEKFRYRVAHKQGENDYYAFQAMKGIQACLEALGQSP